MGEDEPPHEKKKMKRELVADRAQEEENFKKKIGGGTTCPAKEANRRGTANLTIGMSCSPTLRLRRKGEKGELREQILSHMGKKKDRGGLLAYRDNELSEAGWKKRGKIGTCTSTQW